MGRKERKIREKRMFEDMRIKQIQEAAIKVFTKKGFNNATIEDIAEEAELAPSTIYVYFKNKYELSVSLNLITLQILYDEVDNVYKNEKLSTQDKILGLKDAMYKMYEYNPSLLKLIIFVQLNEDLPLISNDILNAVNKLVRQIFNTISGIYQEGVQKGEFEAGHPMAHADIIWGLFSGLMLWEESKKQLNSKKDFLDSTLNRAFEIFIKGIKAD
jgi:AcrR family transcriptional regulator